MKITCESCGSKYTIADAKVKGRKVKVRCKGCKESILVDGTGLDGSGSSDSPEPEDAVPLTDTSLAPRPDTWSVNLSDDDSREMTTDELVRGWRTGVVTSDAYVWKDGMGDWKPILEVGELKLKLGSPASAPGVVSSAGTPSGGGRKTGDLFGGPDLTSHSPSEKPPGFPSVELSKPTGARNDSSVLFSLDNIKSGSDAPRREASGDDIFGNLGMGAGTLTSNTALLTAPAKEPPPAPVGARMAAAVVAPPASAKSNMGPIVGAILGAAVIIGGAIFFMGGDEEGDVSAEESEAAEVAAKQAEEAKKAAEEAKKKAEAERKKLEEERKKLEEQKAKEKEEAEKKAAEEKEPEDKDAAADAAASPSGSTAASTTSPSPAKSSGPGPFNIAAAKSALISAAANAAGCAKPGGPSGSGKVQVTFSPSGRVTSAQVVSGPFGGTAVGGCVASTFRRARVPAFSGGAKTVAKSFRVP